MKLLKPIAKYLILIYCGLFFVFSLFSGAGAGLKGVLYNSPNTIPWIVLGVLAFIAIKEEVVGGIMITAFGLGTILFFNTWQDLTGFLIISLPIVASGILFLVSAEKKLKIKPKPPTTKKIKPMPAVKKKKSKALKPKKKAVAHNRD